MKERLDYSETFPQISPETVKYSEKTYTLLLNLNSEAIDLGSIQERIQDQGFEQKSEYHLTVIGFKAGKEIKAALANFPEGDRAVKILELKALVDGTSWSLNLLPEIYKIHKEYSQENLETQEKEIIETRESIIQLVKVLGLDEFYRKLNQLLNTALEIPPAHITLFTKGTDKVSSRTGIGLNSESELWQLNPVRL